LLDGDGAAPRLSTPSSSDERETRLMHDRPDPATRNQNTPSPQHRPDFAVAPGRMLAHQRLDRFEQARVRDDRRRWLTSGSLFGWLGLSAKRLVQRGARQIERRTQVTNLCNPAEVRRLNVTT
jgi:hypothetical protein